jgi:5-methylthioadenosine/S-adenosylhomocysteine deaminase
MLETKLQRVLGEEKFGGRSLIRYVHDLGFLSDRLNIIHAVWIDDADIDLIAAAGSSWRTIRSATCGWAAA